jgi:hypothetical protein
MAVNLFQSDTFSVGRTTRAFCLDSEGLSNRQTNVS